MDLSENSVPLNQLVNDEFPFYGVYMYDGIQYITFLDKPMWGRNNPIPSHYVLS